ARGELLHLLHQGPLRVRAPRADELARRLGERRVVEDHAVQVEEGLELGRRARRDVRLQRCELLARARNGNVEALNLALEVDLRYLVVRHFQARRGHEVRIADRDPRGDRIAVQDEVHSPSPNLSRISCSSAAIAASASGPSASTSTLVPWPAASIITPMLLFALTRRPLRESQISEAKPLASWVSLAEARACSPSLLTISALALGIAAAVAVHMDDALGASGYCALDQSAQRDRMGAVAAGDDAKEHGERQS